MASSLRHLSEWRGGVPNLLSLSNYAQVVECASAGAYGGCSATLITCFKFGWLTLAGDGQDQLNVGPRALSFLRGGRIWDQPPESKWFPVIPAMGQDPAVTLVNKSHKNIVCQF
jgi:hypothetical protein